MVADPEAMTGGKRRDRSIMRTMAALWLEMFELSAALLCVVRRE